MLLFKLGPGFRPSKPPAVTLVLALTVIGLALAGEVMLLDVTVIVDVPTELNRKSVKVAIPLTKLKAVNAAFRLAGVPVLTEATALLKPRSRLLFTSVACKVG